MLKNYIFIDYEKDERYEIINRGFKKFTIDEKGFVEMVEENKIVNNKKIVEKNEIVKDKNIIEYWYCNIKYIFNMGYIMNDLKNINLSEHDCIRKILNQQKIKNYVKSDLYIKNSNEIFNLKIISIVNNRLNISISIEKDKNFYHKIDNILLK